jgi:hypothetical protein
MHESQAHCMVSRTSTTFNLHALTLPTLAACNLSSHHCAPRVWISCEPVCTPRFQFAMCTFIIHSRAHAHAIAILQSLDATVRNVCLFVCLFTAVNCMPPARTVEIALKRCAMFTAVNCMPPARTVEIALKRCAMFTAVNCMPPARTVEITLKRHGACALTRDDVDKHIYLHHAATC